MVPRDAEKADISADERRLCVPAIDLVVGGRSEDFDASGVLLRFPMILLAIAASGSCSLRLVVLCYNGLVICVERRPTLHEFGQD